MDENTEQDIENKTEEETKSTLTSPDFEKLSESLQILYIRGNQGARIRFMQEFPPVAQYLFGEELIDYDTHGTRDKERREELENDAEARHDELLTLFSELVEKSTLYGSLQTEYVGDLVKKLGRDLSLLIYAEKIVNQFVPAPDIKDTPPLEPTDAEVEETPSQQPVAEVEDTPNMVTSSQESENTPPPHKPRSVTGQITIQDVKS